MIALAGIQAGSGVAAASCTITWSSVTLSAAGTTPGSVLTITATPNVPGGACGSIDHSQTTYAFVAGSQLRQSGPANSYTATGQDVGQTITATESIVTTLDHGSVSPPSNGIGIVAAPVCTITPDPSNPPTLSPSGSVVAGTSLTPSAGAAHGFTSSNCGAGNIVYTYTWQRNNGVGGAWVTFRGPDSSPTSYLTGGSDEGHSVRVVEDATNCCGTGSAEAVSAPVYINLCMITQQARPAISVSGAFANTAPPGSALTAAHGTYSATFCGSARLVYTYHWQRDDGAGAGWQDFLVGDDSTALQYTTTGLDLGHAVRLWVQVTLDTGPGSLASTASASVAITENAPVIAFDAAPANGNKADPFTLTWHADTPLTTWACYLDSDPVACSPSGPTALTAVLTPLTPGLHVFSATATNFVGSSIASAQWTESATGVATPTGIHPAGGSGTNSTPTLHGTFVPADSTLGGLVEYQIYARQADGSNGSLVTTLDGITVESDGDSTVGVPLGTLAVGSAYNLDAYALSETGDRSATTSTWFRVNTQGSGGGDQPFLGLPYYSATHESAVDRVVWDAHYKLGYPWSDITIDRRDNAIPGASRTGFVGFADVIVTTSNAPKTRYVWEIKPTTYQGSSSAHTQLARYLTNLRLLDPSYDVEPGPFIGRSGMILPAGWDPIRPWSGIYFGATSATFYMVYVDSGWPLLDSGLEFYKRVNLAESKITRWPTRKNQRPETENGTRKDPKSQGDNVTNGDLLHVPAAFQQFSSAAAATYGPNFYDGDHWNTDKPISGFCSTATGAATEFCSIPSMS